MEDVGQLKRQGCPERGEHAHRQESYECVLSKFRLEEREGEYLEKNSRVGCSRA